jgi:ribosomal protein S10
MKPCNVTIISNNYKSINNFFLFFFNSRKTSFNVIKKYFQKKRNKKILTILKSPHVNKKAQEQFESRIFSKQLKIYSSQNFQYLIFIKKIKTYLFPDALIKTKFTINQNETKQIRMQIFNPNNFKLNAFKEKKKNIILKIKILIKVFDIYGELTKINSIQCLDSSVGRAKD